MVDLLQTSSIPQLVCCKLRVLQTLFDLDAFLGLDHLTQYDDILHWRVERSVTASFFIVNVLAYHFPVLHIEGLFAEDVVGIDQAVEDEPMEYPSATTCKVHPKKGYFLLVSDSLSV